MNQVAPLPHEWMLISIIGFLVSAMGLFNCATESCKAIDAKTWGFTFAIFFAMIFIASIVSMTQATTDEDHLDELSVHKEHVRKGAHRKKT